MLFGANEHRKDNNEEGDKETADPNHDVNGKFLPPCHAYVLARHAANPANCEVRNQPSHQVRHENPSLAACTSLDLFDLDHGLLVALLCHLLPGL
jgi:hypothetical protein